MCCKNIAIMQEGVLRTIPFMDDILYPIAKHFLYILTVYVRKHM